MYHLVLHVIPFFLDAHLTVDKPWSQGSEFTFNVQVNSVAIPEDSYSSIRLYVTSKLVCQQKQLDVLSCHFQDSQADSFFTDSLDPYKLGTLENTANRQQAYEIHQDQFEIKFSRDWQGLESLVVNENIQPRELDMIRLIVGQLDVGGIVRMANIEQMNWTPLAENFTHGECETIYSVKRGNVDQYGLDVRRDYVLRTEYDANEGEVIAIWKYRMLYKCEYKVPYFFGSATDSKQNNNDMSSLISAESNLLISLSEFVSQTQNVITMGHASEKITLYENISLRLESILPAKGPPPEVKDPEITGVYIGTRMMENSQEDDSSMEE
ncbi:uncharacterized protein LOC143180377 [Calliopsis andreniformis]|uniref:uncharacterized protein LOC143180377 n=1 Tax=Calliopsis andreniformis TaxID=337506 RepID=UPI003FCD1CAC